MTEEIKKCRHYGKDSGHFYMKVCDDCYRERYFACDELLEIREREISRLKELIKRKDDALTPYAKNYEFAIKNQIDWPLEEKRAFEALKLK
jgi:hypothetical protein